MSETPSKNVGLYRVCLELGDTGEDGAPILHLELLVNAASGEVTGQGVQTQAVEPPEDRIPISNIEGQIQGAGIPPYTKIVGLKGGAFHTTGGSFWPFTANFAVDDAWNGKGGWTISRWASGEVPVKSVPCD